MRGKGVPVIEARRYRQLCCSSWSVTPRDEIFITRQMSLDPVSLSRLSFNIMDTPPLHTPALDREIKRPLSFMSRASSFATSIQRDGYFTPVSVASDGHQSSHSNGTNPLSGNGFGIIGSGPPSASSASACGTPVHPFGPVSRPVSSSLVAPPTLVLPQTLSSSTLNAPASPDMPIRFSTPGPIMSASIKSRSLGEVEEELKQARKELTMLKSMVDKLLL